MLKEIRRWRTVKDAVAIVLIIIPIAEIVISNLGNRPEWQLAEDTSAEGAGRLFMVSIITVLVVQQEGDLSKKVIRRKKPYDERIEFGD